MTGAPFSSYVVVKEAHFAVTTTHQILANYAVTERTKRHFCVTCGTPIFNSNPHTYKGLAMIYLGTVVGHENLAPELSIYCESKLPWVDIRESSKRFPCAPTRDVALDPGILSRNNPLLLLQTVSHRTEP